MDLAFLFISALSTSGTCLPAGGARVCSAGRLKPASSAAPVACYSQTGRR